MEGAGDQVDALLVGDAADEADQGNVVLDFKVQLLLQRLFIQRLLFQRAGVVARGQVRIAGRVPFRGIDAVQDAGERVPPLRWRPVALPSGKSAAAISQNPAKTRGILTTHPSL